jgi:hypothetical protein
MRKLRLDLEELTVESFEMDEQEGSRGTVQGHAPETWGCDSRGCDTYWSCEGGASRCDWLCSATNDASCSCPDATCSITCP